MAPHLKRFIIQGKRDHLEVEFPFAMVKKEWQKLGITAAFKQYLRWSQSLVSANQS
jgi:ABC-type sulfate transport system substrate-binding protein